MRCAIHQPNFFPRLNTLANYAVGASEYLCGTGGMRYIEHEPFTVRGRRIIPFCVPSSGDVWGTATRLSSLWSLLNMGLEGLRGELARARTVTARPESA